MTIFLNLLFGLIFDGAGGRDDSNPDNLGSHFGALAMVTIGSMFGAAQPIMLGFPMERPVFLREYSTGTYSTSAYFLTKMLVEAPLTYLQCMVAYLLTFFLLELRGRSVEGRGSGVGGRGLRVEARGSGLEGQDHVELGEAVDVVVLGGWGGGSGIETRRSAHTPFHDAHPPPPFRSFFVLVTYAWLLGMSSASVAVIIGCSVANVKDVAELAPAVFVPQMLFAGFFVRTSFIPSWLRWAQYLCALKYSLNLITIEEFRYGSDLVKFLTRYFYSVVQLFRVYIF